MNFTESFLHNDTVSDILNMEAHNYSGENKNKTVNNGTVEIFDVEDVTWAYLAIPLILASITAGIIIRYHLA